MIDELRQVFSSVTKALEILYVIEGVKPVARIMVDEKEISLIKGFLEEKGLKYCLSDFKISKEIDKSKHYSNKGCKIFDKSLAGDYFMYISKFASNLCWCFKALCSLF